MSRHIVCVATLLVGLSSLLLPQDLNSDKRFSKDSIKASEAQVERIQLELHQSNNPGWAGEYYFGDGLGVNVTLTLAPQSGFVFDWRGCLGLYDLNYGEVQFTNGTVRLLFKYPNRLDGFLGISPELIPVRWGKRHYLIDPHHVVDFTNAINAGTEQKLFLGRSNRFLLRRGDEKEPVAGRPGIPPEFLSYLLTKPIKARILSVEKTQIADSDRVTHVTVDAGSVDGLKKGMELYLRRPSRLYASAVVTSVNEHSASAVIEQIGLSDPVPAVDWGLSTKL